MPPVVALYGCEMTQAIATDGCQSVAIDKPYKPIYASNVSISKEQSNKLNTIENNNEQST